MEKKIPKLTLIQGGKKESKRTYTNFLFTLLFLTTLALIIYEASKL